MEYYRNFLYVGEMLLHLSVLKTYQILYFSTKPNNGLKTLDILWKCLERCYEITFLLLLDRNHNIVR